MKEIQFKSVPFECKVDLEKGTFEGYASVFGNKDSYGDIIEPGAFKKTIKEFGHRVKVLYQHDPWTPIGKPIHMEEDSKGLYTVSKISETSIGKDVLILLRDGVINELSIGYTPIKETWDNENKVRHLNEVKLWEYSPVTWAANELAVITGVKNDVYPLLNRVRGFNNAIKQGGLTDELVKEALKAIEELKALLGEYEPDKKSTQKPNEAASKGNIEPVEIHSILELMKKIKNEMKGRI